ncbi:MAG: Hsp20/alpha crystallin family protein [Alphaproteobacteria bacterium]
MAEQAIHGDVARMETTRALPTFTPSTDIYETGDDLVVMVEMPGVGADGIDIKLDNRTLMITGCGETTTIEGYAQTYAEYRDGNYHRSFTLSEDIDEERIHATMKDGLLKLTLPKASPPPTKTITVKAG